MALELDYQSGPTGEGAAARAGAKARVTEFVDPSGSMAGTGGVPLPPAQ